MPNSPEAPQPISRSERRKLERQDKKAQEARDLPNRRLLIFGGAAAGLGVVAAGGSYFMLNRPGTTPPAPDNRPLTPELMLFRLSELDRKIRENPASAKEAAAEASNLALNYFSTEMNRLLKTNSYNSKRFDGKVFYQYDQEYAQSRDTESGCTSVDNYGPGEFGRVQAESDKIFVNISEAIYAKELGPNRLTNNPAYFIFATVIHEAHHAFPPMINLTNSKNFFDQGLNRNMTITKKRGVTTFAPQDEFSKPGQLCLRFYRRPLEEALVQQSTDQMLKKLGVNIDATPDYRRWINAYQAGIINPLFNGDNSILLGFHQKSDDDGFFRAIGQKLGIPADVAAQVGEDYAFKVIASS